jgi:protein AbiQ
MRFIFLSAEFYREYAQCGEIERKPMRLYVQAYVTVNNVQFAVPLRSGIRHKEHVLWTNKAKGCGLDFSKAVVIADEKYINKEAKPYIRKDEFDSLRGKEYIVKKKLLKYIQDYKDAKTRLDIKRNQYLCAYSTMQYFEEHIENIGTEVRKGEGSG